MNRQDREKMFLNALAEKAGALFAAEDPDAVYRAAGEILSEDIGYMCAVFAIEDNVLVLKHVSVSEQLKALARKATGLDAHNFSMAVEDLVVYEALRETHEPVYVNDIRDITRRALDNVYKQRPGAQMFLVKGITGIMQFISDTIFPFMNKRVISAPVVVDEDIDGVIHVFGDDLTPESIPPLKVFAVTIAAAVKQKKLEAALRDSVAQYRRALETMPHIVLEIDLQGRITYANPAAIEMLGESETVLGADILDFIPDRDRRLETVIFRKEPEIGPAAISAQVRGRGGERRTLLLNVMPIQSNGAPSGATIFGVVADAEKITSTKN